MHAFSLKVITNLTFCNVCAVVVVVVQVVLVDVDTLFGVEGSEILTGIKFMDTGTHFDTGCCDGTHF